MSAFICSDKHFATVAKYIFLSDNDAQHFADTLKRENVRSVNHRYKEKTRFRPVNLKQADRVSAYSDHDILALLECIDYQSCEHPTYNETTYKLAVRWLESCGANRKQAKPGLWSI
jgi:hypothetical protein